VTNADFDTRRFLAKFKGAAKFLYSPLAQFGVEDTIRFFEGRGMPIKIEAEKRAFPQSDSAQSVLDALVRYMTEGKVTIMTNAEVMGFETESGDISGVRLKGGEVLRAKSYVLATGGKSRPETGSTGEGFRWLKKVGHQVNESRSALVPLRVKEKWAHSLSGLSFTDAKLSVFRDGKKQESRRGKILFTHFGLSGPLALNMSRSISEALPYGTVTVSVDLRPEINIGELDAELRALLDTQKNKQLKNSLDGFAPVLLIPILINLAGVSPEKPVHSVSRAERLALVRLMKGLVITVTGLLGADKAIVTSGGVSLEEVDCKYMRSRLYPNLYLVGDILDIDRPSGGYSLQLCWTTGYVAGTAATE
jgi:predicted Rossmann fold flavoprotein